MNVPTPQVRPSGLNPRTTRDRQADADLRESIREQVREKLGPLPQENPTINLSFPASGRSHA